ncbi:MAG: glutamine-hydrolyzing GMP synthase [Eubacteriales bacterium]|nr:glutamine-hydrolyzing GMP synthase [Eubacteriales bacterium]
MSNREKIIVLDFGGQYNQLIARRVRELGVYCEVKPYTMPIDEIKEENPIGIIFTGGPQSVYLDDSPKVDKEIFSLGIPILGICYGCQLIAQLLGGSVVAASDDNAREYGKTNTYLNPDCEIFDDIPENSSTWMSHGDYMEKVPNGFVNVGHSAACPNAAIANKEKRFYALQFHPEVNHTEYGKTIIKNFLYKVCQAKGDWNMDDFGKITIQRLKSEIGENSRILLALSGGVDSAVLAALLSRVVGKRLTCVFVDHGLMRKDEGDEIEATFKSWDINFVRVNTEKRFLDKLKNIEDPQEKRHIIGAEFGYVFRDEAEKFGITNSDYLAQGTIYPDVIESGEGDAEVIKSHHNKLLPPEVIARFKGIVEPLDLLFKDEVRALGRNLGLPETIINRQPFPGPGLAIRIIGDVTQEKADTLRQADYIMREEIANAGEDKNINQYFAVLTNLRSVGVMGDGRTYDYTLALRAVTTTDFMTADYARIPYDILDRISNRIINEVKGINRIVYDITSKPPATVEWE